MPSDPTGEAGQRRLPTCWPARVADYECLRCRVRLGEGLGRPTCDPVCEVGHADASAAQVTHNNPVSSRFPRVPHAAGLLSVLTVLAGLLGMHGLASDSVPPVYAAAAAHTQHSVHPQYDSTSVSAASAHAHEGGLLTGVPIEAATEPCCGHDEPGPADHGVHAAGVCMAVLSGATFIWTAVALLRRRVATHLSVPSPAQGWVVRTAERASAGARLLTLADLAVLRI